MKTKLLALLFLVGSAAFAGPRIAIGVGIGPIGVGVAPAYGYYAPPPPAVAYVAPAPVYYGPRLETVTTEVFDPRRHLAARPGCLRA